MSPDDESVGPGEDPELGQPVTELRDVSVALEEQFVTRVRGRIERRVLTGDGIELIWTAPFAMLLEFLRWPFDLLSGKRN